MKDEMSHNDHNDQIYFTQTVLTFTNSRMP